LKLQPIHSWQKDVGYNAIEISRALSKQSMPGSKRYHVITRSTELQCERLARTLIILY